MVLSSNRVVVGACLLVLSVCGVVGQPRPATPTPKVLVNLASERASVCLSDKELVVYLFYTNVGVTEVRLSEPVPRVTSVMAMFDTNAVKPRSEWLSIATDPMPGARKRSQDLVLRPGETSRLEARYSL